MGTDLRRLQKLIEKIINKAEEEALAEGVNIASKEFQVMLMQERL